MPRGGRWLVSLCAGIDRWRTIPWVGSHAEADYVADGYRRRCKRVAVHREGQPPRERTAPVLSTSYRPPVRRDVASIETLLREFTRRNDRASAEVLNDVLIEEGYDWAAYDLMDSLRLGCRDRRGIAERILSEVLNDSTVLDHGEWRFPRVTDDPRDLNPYVLILERRPVRFRGSSRHTRRLREPRLVIWSRAGRAGNCRWELYGTYPLVEYRSLADAEQTAHADIAYEQLDKHDRAQLVLSLARSTFRGGIPRFFDDLRRI